MRAILNTSENSSRSRTAAVWIAVLFVLTICLGATAANAVTPPRPAIVTSQVTWLNTLGSGGALSSGNAAGSNFAVNSGGDVVVSNTYGNEVFLINGQTGAETTIASWSGYNIGPIALDSQDNLYIAGLYTNSVIKIPFVAGAYVAAPTPGTPAPPNCTGTDTAECNYGSNLTNATNGYYFGISTMTFDAAGDFFFGLTNANTAKNAIYECTAACISTGTPPATIIFEEPTAADSATTGQLTIGGMAVDPWGNLFFTDSSENSGGNESYSSNLNELATSSGAGFGGVTTGFKAAPIVIASEVPNPPGQYDDELDGVAIDSNGTVYLADQYNGVTAYLNNAGTVDKKSVYGVSTQGAKLLTLDNEGNAYIAVYSKAINSGGTDTVARISVDNLWAPASPVGTAAAAANVTVLVNDGVCGAKGAGPTVTIAGWEGGLASTEFSGSVTKGTCVSQPGGASYAAAVNFTPTNAGDRSAVLVVKDTTNKGSGSATASGVGQGQLVTLDPGVWTAYNTGFTNPESISVDAAGDIVVADAGANSVFWIGHGTTTPVAIGTGFSGPDATAFDANGNLYIADAGNKQIVEIPNTAGSLVPASQSVAVADTVMFGGTALSHPSGLAVGPDGVVYIADLGDGSVFTWNPSNGATGVRAAGLSFPWGLAVDAANNLYVAETGGGEVLVYSGSTLTKLAPSGVSAPWAVAVDASGSVLISDKSSGNIVRVPNVAGTLTDSDAVVVEKNPSSALGLALDVWGNMYSTDGTGKAAYAVKRTGAALTFGTVTDGQVSAPEDLLVESAGNMPLGIAAPGTPTGPYVFLPAVQDACGAAAFASSVDAGLVCDLAVKFAPVSPDSGAIAGSATLTFAGAPNAPTANVALSGTASKLGTKPQKITFTAPMTPVTYGVAPITLVASASSGLAIKFTVTGPAKVSGKLLTITGAGSVVVTATQGGDATYAAAPDVPHSIAVGKASLTVTANNATVVFGKALPTFTYTATGFVNADTKAVLSGTPTFSTTAKVGSLPGKYTITIAKGTLTATSYLFAFKGGSLTITSAGPTAKPTFEGTLGATSISVKLVDANPKAVIYYALNGAVPTAGSKVYTTPLTLKSSEVIEAIAVAPGYTASPVATKSFVLPTAAPKILPATETTSAPVAVTITDATPAAVIYYTTNGDKPTTASTKYTAGFTVSATATVKAIAVAPKYATSTVTSATYTIN